MEKEHPIHTKRKSKKIHINYENGLGRQRTTYLEELLTRSDVAPSKLKFKLVKRIVQFKRGDLNSFCVLENI